MSTTIQIQINTWKMLMDIKKESKFTFDDIVVELIREKYPDIYNTYFSDKKEPIEA